MAFTAKDVLKRVRVTLNDAASVRWTLPEMLDYLNDGLREIALQKPSATSVTATITLEPGTKQSIPATYHALIQVIRNTTGDVSPVPGKAVTPIARETIDTAIPGWHDNDVLPFTKVVTHVLDEIVDQTVFYVIPGNDGTGHVEAILSKIPTQIAAPANPLDIDSYTTNVDIADIYRNALTDYILYRAFSKDTDLATSGQRSAAHLQLFQTALGLKKQAEVTENVNTTYKTA